MTCLLGKYGPPAHPARPHRLAASPQAEPRLNVAAAPHTAALALKYFRLYQRILEEVRVHVHLARVVGGKLAECLVPEAGRYPAAGGGGGGGGRQERGGEGGRGRGAEAGEPDRVRVGDCGDQGEAAQGRHQRGRHHEAVTSTAAAEVVTSTAQAVTRHCRLLLRLTSGFDQGETPRSSVKQPGPGPGSPG